MSRTEASDLVHSLFACWYPALVRYALRATGTLEVAEDVAQETFMLLYKALRSGQKIENPKGWTLCVVRRQISKQKRSAGRDLGRHMSLDILEFLPAGRLEPEQAAFQGDGASRLLSMLTPREGEVVLLRMQALKYREIAVQLGISSNSVNTLLSRALRKLTEAAREKSAGESIANALKKAFSKTL